MKKISLARKSILIAVASLVMAFSLLAAPSTAFARKVGPGKYIVVTDPLTITLDCDDTSWNPTCTTTTVSNIGLTTYSFFYIDGRLRGFGDVNFTQICSTFRLRDGWHTAKLFARDSQFNKATIGPFPIIHCDRSGPVVFTGVRRIRGIVVANPTASDRWSGVNAATEVFSVDGTAQTWQSYWNICLQLALAPGTHVAVASAADNAGNQGSRAGSFHCD
jgi:hypothetical protein